MKQRRLHLWTILFFTILAACSKDDGAMTPEEPVKSTLKQITTFIFKADVNNALSMDINASINEADKIITATVPYGTDVSALKPEIAISEKASVSNDSFTDFTEIVKITVTAEDGSTARYDVVITIESNTAKNILAFAFPFNENPIAVTIIGTIDQETNTITFETPLGTDISALLPQIQVSTDAHFSPEGFQDFSKPVVYTVTAEDGSTEDYTVIWKISQRDVLHTLYNDNPNNTLSWDITDNNVSNWEGVTVDTEGTITALDLTDKNLLSIPGVIGRLTGLKSLILDTNLIGIIPDGIGTLENLVLLSALDNRISILSTEIGQLTQLRRLLLKGNQLMTLPKEIGNLSNLIELKIEENEMNSLPPEFSQLLLKKLNLSANNWTVVPVAVFRMPELEELLIEECPFRLSFPPEMGEAKNLQILSMRKILFDNIIRLTDGPDGPIEVIGAIPDEIGNIESLTRLRIIFSDGVRIPASIGLLPNIETIDLGSSLLFGNIPPEMGQLSSLKTLGYRNCGLPNGSLPEELGLLTNLETLDLILNPRITMLPPAICDLQDTGTQLLLDSTTVCQ